MRLKILVGTVTNTAEYVAQAIEMDCADLVGQIDVQMMDKLDISVFDEPGLYLICTSTYGTGDVPDNAHGLYASLQNQPRFLGHVHYGVIALGDRTYGPTFANGGRLFDQALADLGARRIGEVWCHDASAGNTPEADGAAWCRAWLPRALAALPAPTAA